MIRRKLPVAPPNSGRPPVRQRSGSELSSGPSFRLMRAITYRGGASERRGEVDGSYFPPAHPGRFFLQVSVDCSSARRKSRSADDVFWASGVDGGKRPLGGSTIFDVRAPVRFVEKNVAALYAPLISRSVAKRVSTADRALSNSERW